jgi:hypothetical protein
VSQHSQYSFVRPGNINGLGFLIVFGGVPQFSIAWDATREPERISLENAAGEGLQINGMPASQFEIAEIGGKLVLKSIPQETETTDQGSQDQGSSDQASEDAADQSGSKKKQAEA